MLLFCNKVHITTVRVHQIAPLTHKYSHTNTSYPNDRVTVTGLWYCMRMAEFGYYTSDSETDDEPLPYEPDYVPNFEFDSTESYTEFCIDGL